MGPPPRATVLVPCRDSPGGGIREMMWALDAADAAIPSADVGVRRPLVLTGN